MAKKTAVIATAAFAVFLLLNLWLAAPQRASPYLSLTATTGRQLAADMT